MDKSSVQQQRARHLRQSFLAALPIVAGYVVLGIPCGVLGVQAGMSLAQVALMSLLFYSGAGQYLIPNMWLTGAPIASIVASVSLVNTRQILYGASLARFCEHAGKRLSLLFAATVTDESFGVNIARFTGAETGAGGVEASAGAASAGAAGAGDGAAGATDAGAAGADAVGHADGTTGAGGDAVGAAGADWGVARATLVNLFAFATWALANVAGALVGALLSVPVALASFAMTSIFLCLLFMQGFSRPAAVSAVVAAIGVLVCKLLGLAGPAIFIGAVLGVCAAMLTGAGVRRTRDGADERERLRPDTAGQERLRPDTVERRRARGAVEREHAQRDTAGQERTRDGDAP